MLSTPDLPAKAAGSPNSGGKTASAMVAPVSAVRPMSGRQARPLPPNRTHQSAINGATSIGPQIAWAHTTAPQRVA